MESVLPKLNPLQDKKMNKLLRNSNIPFLRDYNFMQSKFTVVTVKNFLSGDTFQRFESVSEGIF